MPCLKSSLPLKILTQLIFKQTYGNATLSSSHTPLHANKGLWKGKDLKSVNKSVPTALECAKQAQKLPISNIHSLHKHFKTFKELCKQTGTLSPLDVLFTHTHTHKVCVCLTSSWSEDAIMAKKGNLFSLFRHI